MEKVTRSRRKCWTVISGLENYDVKLKAVSKAISKKFATSSSVKKNPGGGEHIDVQGDITATLPPLLTGEFGIPSDKIFFQDGKTKISWCVQKRHRIASAAVALPKFPRVLRSSHPCIAPFCPHIRPFHAGSTSRRVEQLSPLTRCQPQRCARQQLVSPATTCLFRGIAHSRCGARKRLPHTTHSARRIFLSLVTIVFAKPFPENALCMTCIHVR